MYITHLRIQNFEGLVDLSLDPSPSINLIEGSNGSGKTSILEAIRAAFTNRAERSRLVHDQAGTGLILFETDSGWTAEREVLDGGRTCGRLTLNDRITGQVPQAQAVVNELLGSFGFNPLEFFSLKADKQAEHLLSSIPLNLPYDELLRLSGGTPLPGVSYLIHPLLTLRQIEKQLYDLRRDTSRDAKQQRTAAIALRAAIPNTFDPASWDPTKINLTTLMDDLVLARGHNDEYDRLIAESQRLTQELERVRQALAKLTTRIDTAEIESQIRTYTERAKYADQITLAQTTGDEAARLELRVEALSSLIEEVRNKPIELMSSSALPIPDLAVNEEGLVTIKGIPLSDLSTGEQLRLSVEIALRSLKDLRIILVDGLETLSPENQDFVLTRLYESGVQAFVTQVADGYLRIITDYRPGELITAPIEDLSDAVPF